MEKRILVACFFKDPGRCPPNASSKVLRNASKTTETSSLEKTEHTRYLICRLTLRNKKVTGRWSFFRRSELLKKLKFYIIANMTLLLYMCFVKKLLKLFPSSESSTKRNFLFRWSQMTNWVPNLCSFFQRTRFCGFRSVSWNFWTRIRPIPVRVFEKKNYLGSVSWRAHDVIQV